ncbi:hypothetical protein G5714_000202 [Onychostoma macrolepis]|uniref:Uncharacterized protein n=1 Tax=Onychostoma macrolepis TaxID=369639 RepID=A0A7J6DGE9_9TELE|nr:hypothetical protein G5714_000202 [Onychostoma macrolepis]
MSCTYTYPPKYRIMKVFWTKGPVIKGLEPPDLSEDPEYSQRLQYLGDEQQNCTIRLSHISDPNEDTYTALELKSMTSDLYDTLSTVHPRPPGDFCTTLDPKHENPSINRKMLQ